MRTDLRRERFRFGSAMVVMAALLLASGNAEARRTNAGPPVGVAPLDPSLAGIPLDPSWPKHVFVVTDSVMLGAKQKFIDALPDWKVTFTGRPALMVDKGLDEYVLGQRNTGPVAVVALGYNTLWEKDRRNFKRWADRFDSHVEKMNAALKERGAKKIVWVMLRELTPDMATGRQGHSQYNRYAWYFPYVNERLQAIKERHPEMALADWVKAGKQSGVTYDLIHLNRRGADVMVEVVKTAMGVYGNPAPVAAARPAPVTSPVIATAPLPAAERRVERAPPVEQVRAEPAEPVRRVTTVVQSREAAGRAAAPAQPAVERVSVQRTDDAPASLIAPEPAPRLAQLPEPIDPSSRKSRGKPRDMFGLTMFPSAAVVMLGDSLTQRAQWAEITGCNYVVNRGIGGDQSAGLLRRLDDVTMLKPSAVFLMIGINDLHRKVPVETIVSNVRKTIEQLNESGTKVYLTLTLPVSRGYVPRMNSTVAELNAAYMRIAKETNATVVDFRDDVTSDGALRTEMTVDGLHLSTEGYRAWRDAITPLVRKHCASGPSEDIPVAQAPARPIRTVAARPLVEPATPAPVAALPLAPVRLASPAAAPVPLLAPEVTASIAPTARASNGAWIIQLGAFPEQEKAQDRIREAQDLARDMLISANPFTEKVVKGDKELFRARFAGFSQSAAQAACSYFKRNAIDCISMKR